MKQIKRSWLICVSIPRRYAKNCEKRYYAGHYRWFQSLVGTLKTLTQGPGQSWQNVFQSLVGTLKTGISNNSPNVPYLFQSLVGTLKTESGRHARCGFHGVSIPRRYAKNEEELKYLRDIAEVSIPRRYAKNPEAAL